MNTSILTSFQKLISDTQNEIDNLKLIDPSKAKPTQFRLRNFKKALKIIENHPKEILSGEDLREYKGIGNGLVSRVQEILDKGKLSYDTNQSTEHVNDFKDLQRLTGVGPVKARKLLNMDITLDKLKNDLSLYKDELNHHQLLGLKYFEDFETKIPRNEIISMEKKILKILKNLDPNIEIHICGSFRRKKSFSGDIDMLITHNKINSWDDLEETNILDHDPLVNIVSLLKDKDIIVDDLTTKGNTKYMGVCKLNMKSLGRRIDIRMVPKESLACALLYFTGSGEFNKNMRTYALKNGFTINEYSIRSINKITKKILEIRVETEKDIFDVLNLPYYLPEERTEFIKFV